MQLISTINKFIPSILAVLNILFMTRMYNTIITQNTQIIALLSTYQQEIIEKSIKIPVENIPSSPITAEYSFWNTIILYGTPIACITVFGIAIYLYYFSGGSGPTSPSPDLSTVIIKKAEEKSNDILEIVSKKSTEIVSTAFENANISGNSVNNVNLEPILSGLYEQVRINNIAIATLSSNQAKIESIFNHSIDLITSGQTEGLSHFMRLGKQHVSIKKLLVDIFNAIGELSSGS